MKKVDEREQQKSKNPKEHGLMEAVVKVKALYKSKHVVVECRCLQIWHFLPMLLELQLAQLH